MNRSQVDSSGNAGAPHRYGCMTRVLSAALFPLGWLELAAYRSSEEEAVWIMQVLGKYSVYLFAGILVGGILGIAAILFFLVRSLPNKEKREDETVCIFLPALLVSAGILLVIVPMLEISARGIGLPSQERFDAWCGAFGGLGIMTVAIIGCTLIGPLQFLWRNCSMQARCAWILVLVIPPIVASLPVPFAFNWRSLCLAALTLLAVIVAVITSELWRHSLEIEKQLLPGVLGGENHEVSKAYDVDQTVRRVGVALAGGGYRASLFALGALMYIHDACRMTGEKQRKVVAVSSVSGGSITNGVVAHGVELGKDDSDAMDQVAQRLIRHTISTGSMFGGAARLYYWLLLPVCSLLSALLLGLAIRDITWPIFWRAALIPLLAGAMPALFAVLPSGGNKALRNTFEWILVMGCLVAPLLLICFVLSHSLWRISLGWLSLSFVVVLGFGAIWSLRGSLLRENFEVLLKATTASTPMLKNSNVHTHHVFCATEVQLDESVFLAHDVIRSRSFPPTRPGNLRTSVAIRASAALPIAFPPVFLQGFKERFVFRMVERDSDSRVAPKRMVLVDGGVRDNLGTGWFERYTPAVDDLVVVSSATNRHRPKIVSTIPGLSEMISLINIINIPYNTRERNSRRAVLSELFAAGRPEAERKTRGALIHIEDSPFDLATMLKSTVNWKGSPGVWLEQSGMEDWDVNQLIAVMNLRIATQDHDELLRRADAVVNHLNGVEEKLPAPPSLSLREHSRVSGAISVRSSRTGKNYLSLGTSAEIAWWKRVEATSMVGTKLSKIDKHDAMNLLLQGFYLTMTNLHITADWPLSDAMDIARMEKLLGGLPGTTESVAIKTRHEEYVKLQSTPLDPAYTMLSIYAFGTMVRSLGDLERREVVAILGIGVDGRLHLLGMWLAPSSRTIETNPFERKNVIEAIQREFRRQVFGDLKRRGCKMVAVFHRKLNKHVWSEAAYSPLDEEFTEAYPKATIVPHFWEFITSSTLWQTTINGDAREIKDDLFQVLQEPGDAEALAHLERSRMKWSPKNDKYPRIYASWTEEWGKFAPFFSLTPTVRKVLLELDSRLKVMSQALSSNSDKSGAFESEDDALAGHLVGVRSALKGVKMSHLRKHLMQWGAALARTPNSIEP